MFRFELILLECPKGAKGRILQPQYSDIYTFVVSSKCIYSVNLLFWLKKQVLIQDFMVRDPIHWDLDVVKLSCP